MQLKFKLLTIGLLLHGPLLLSEIEEEIVVLEKKILNLSGWSENVSISSINSSELNKLEAQHSEDV